MGSMPKYVRPDDQPAELEAFVAVFGNRARLSIVRYLEENGASLRVDIAEATQLANPTLGHHLAELERIGAINADLPPERRRGRTVRYSISGQRLRELMSAPEAYIFDATPENDE